MTSTKIPASLRQALGDGQRSIDFEQFQLGIAAGIQSAAEHTDPRIIRLVRFMELFSVAAVEGANQMVDGKPMDAETFGDIARAMVRGGMLAIGYAVFSQMNDDTPASALRDFLTVMTADAIEEVIRTQGLK